MAARTMPIGFGRERPMPTSSPPPSTGSHCGSYPAEACAASSCCSIAASRLASLSSILSPKRCPVPVDADMSFVSRLDHQIRREQACHTARNDTTPHASRCDLLLATDGSTPHAMRRRRLLLTPRPATPRVPVPILGEGELVA